MKINPIKALKLVVTIISAVLAFLQASDLNLSDDSAE